MKDKKYFVSYWWEDEDKSGFRNEEYGCKEFDIWDFETEKAHEIGLSAIVAVIFYKEIPCKK